MRGRIEPFYKEVSDPVAESKSVNVRPCVKCCDRGLHRDADKRYLEESCQGGLPGGGDT